MEAYLEGEKVTITMTLREVIESLKTEYNYSKMIEDIFELIEEAAKEALNKEAMKITRQNRTVNYMDATVFELEAYRLKRSAMLKDRE